MEGIAARATLDRQMAELRRRIAEMGELATSQLERVLAALAGRDQEAARSAADADQVVDDNERAIDLLALRVMALQQPEARDLRALLAAIAVAGSLERIGDHAKNIARQLPATDVLARLPEDMLTALGAAALRQLRQVMDAFHTDDAALALAVRDQDAELDRLYAGCCERVVSAMERDNGCIRAGVYALHAARCLERIGDHVTNIAERIHFEAQGTVPKEPRLRGDAAS